MWVAMSLLAGAALLGFATRETVIQQSLQRRGTRVGGLVVGHHESGTKRHGGPAYFAVVEFVDAQGIRHIFQSSSSGVNGLPVGGRVPVRYHPDTPKLARIDLASRRIGDVVFLFAGGSLFTAAGIWMLVTGR